MSYTYHTDITMHTEFTLHVYDLIFICGGGEDGGGVKGEKVWLIYIHKKA